MQLDTQAPARPTIESTPAATRSSSYALAGTKTPDTSVWINGTMVVPSEATTTWATSVNLVEGDNILTITTKNALGNESAANTINIIVDNLPPVITTTPPAKTNLNPFTLTGTVDDSMTQVVVNGVTASRVSKNFQAAVALTEGSNTVTITATNPNGYVTIKTLPLTLGTIPTVTTIQPPDGAKLYGGIQTTIQTSATDKESDPLQYQVLLDGQTLFDWSADATHGWTPDAASLGIHTIEVRVRDAFGGYGSKQAEVYVLRKPITPQ